MPNRGRRIAAKKALLGKKKKIKRLSIKSPTNGVLPIQSSQHSSSSNPIPTPKESGVISTHGNNDKSGPKPQTRVSSGTALTTMTRNPSKSISRASTHDTVYRYIQPELQRIGICSSIVLGLLIILSFILT